MVREAGVQAVSICTPHPLHADAIEAAAANGAHVLVEKPLAATLADCDRAIGACAAAGVRLGVISQRRFYPPIVRMKAAIDAGKIGAPVLATVDILGWRDEAYYASNPWRGTWAGEGGGVLVNQAPHQLDLLQWFMGPVEELSGYWDNLNHPSIPVDDTAVAVIRFRSGGARRASSPATRSARASAASSTSTGRTGRRSGPGPTRARCSSPGSPRRVEPAVNDLWTIEGEADRLPGWQAEDRAFAAAHDPMSWFHERQIEDFLDAILEDRPPAVDGAEGRKVVELFTAIYRSQRDHRPVAFPLDPEADRDDLDGRLAPQPTTTGRPMKALLLTAPGVLEIADVPEPAMGDDDVLVASAPSASAAATSTAWTAAPAGASRRSSWGTRRPGSSRRSADRSTAGPPGDPVTFDSTVYCGACAFCVEGLINLCDRRRVLGVATDEYRRDGAFAERVAVPARILHRLPAGVSMVEAALAEPLAVALHAVSRAPVAGAESVLVVGDRAHRAADHRRRCARPAASGSSRSTSAWPGSPARRRWGPRTSSRAAARTSATGCAT